MKAYRVTRPPVVNCPSQMNVDQWMTIGHPRCRLSWKNGWYISLYWNKTVCVKVVHPAMNHGDAVFPISAAGQSAIDIAISFGLLIKKDDHAIDPTDFDHGPTKMRDRSQRYRDI